jgi:hypothetical protein
MHFFSKLQVFLVCDRDAELIVKALETQHQGTHTPPAACPYVHDAEEAHYFLTEEHLAAQPDHHTSGQSSFWIPSVRITEGSDYLHGITGIDRFYVCILRQFFADAGLAPHVARHTAVVLYEAHQVRGPYDLVHSWRNGTIASQFLQTSLNFIDFNKIRRFLRQIWPISTEHCNHPPEELKLIISQLRPTPVPSLVAGPSTRLIQS